MSDGKAGVGEFLNCIYPCFGDCVERLWRCVLDGAMIRETTAVVWDVYMGIHVAVLMIE